MAQDSKEDVELETRKAKGTLALYAHPEDKCLHPSHNVTLFAEGIVSHTTTDICYVT